jgi:hypothetical protein
MVEERKGSELKRETEAQPCVMGRQLADADRVGAPDGRRRRPDELRSAVLRTES